MVLPTLVEPYKPVFPVQVVNLSREHLWLRPRIRLAVLCEVECVEVEVHFNCISADHEEMSVERKEMKTDTELQSLMENIGGSSEQQYSLAALLAQYADVFAFKDEDLG